MASVVNDMSSITDENELPAPSPHRKCHSAQRPKARSRTVVTSFSPAMQKSRTPLSKLELNLPARPPLDKLLKGKTYSLLEESHAKCKEQLGELITLGEMSILEEASEKQDAAPRVEPIFAEEEAAECTRCEELQSVVDELRVQLINSQEDAMEYESQYTKIQDEGSRLYEVYEVKLKQLEELQARLKEAEGSSENLFQENQMVKQEYNKICEAYTELAEQFTEMQTQIEDKKAECVSLSNRVLELSTENTKLKEGIAAPAIFKSEDLEALKTAVTEREQAYDEACAYIEKMQEELEKMTDKASSASENTLGMQATIDRLTTEREALAKELASSKVQSSEPHKELETMRIKLQEVIASISAGDEADADARTKMRVDTLRLSNQILREENVTANKMLEKMQSQLETAENQVSQMSATILTKEQETKSYRADIEENFAQLKDAYTQKEEELMAQLESTDSELQACKTSLEELSDLSSRHSEATTYINTLEEKIKTQELEYENLSFDMQIMHKKFDRDLTDLEKQYKHNAYQAKYAQVSQEKKVLSDERDQVYQAMAQAEELDMLQAELQAQLQSKMQSLSVASQEVTNLKNEKRRLEIELREQVSLASQMTQTISYLQHKLESSNTKCQKLLHQAVFGQLLQMMNLKQQHTVLKKQLKQAHENALDEAELRKAMDLKTQSLQQDIASHQNELQWLKDQLMSMKKEKEDLAEFIEEERLVTSDITNTLESRTKQLEDLLLARNAECEKLIKMNETSGEQLSTYSEHLESLQTKLLTVEQKFSEESTERAEAEMQLEALTREHEHLLAQNEALKKIESELVQAQKQIGQIQPENRQLSIKLSKSLADLEAALAKVSQIGGENIELTRQLRALTDTTTQQANQLEAADLHAKMLQQSIDKLNTKLQKSTDELVSAKGTILSLENTLLDSDRKYMQSQTNLSRTTKEMLELRDSNNTYTIAAAKAEGRIDALQSQIQQLQGDLQRKEANTEDSMLASMKADMLQKELGQVQEKLSEAKSAIQKLEGIIQEDKNTIQELQASQPTDAPSASDAKKLAKLIKQKAKLLEEVTKLNESQAQLKQYMLLYKKKSDEKQAITDAEAREQANKLKLLENKLRHTKMVLARYKDVLDTEPELAGALQSLEDIDISES